MQITPLLQTPLAAPKDIWDEPDGQPSPSLADVLQAGELARSRLAAVTDVDTCRSTLFTFVEFAPATVWLRIEPCVAPEPCATIGVLLAHTRAFGGASDGCVARPDTAFIVKAAAIAHGH
jgi:hypothetical protein